jgi:hypothetical protein
LFLTDLDAYGLQVDAALDLSHTQNIGRMIKAHFPHSQVNQVTNFYFFCLFYLLRREYCGTCEGYVLKGGTNIFAVYSRLTERGYV